jgi:dTDP-4-amino-4,6-dideoxygalactose transaminase
VKKIPFNKPFIIGKEMQYISEAVASGRISGNGRFTKKCHAFFEDLRGFKKALLTSSCTDALEMSSILADIQPGDEVIMPTFSFVSTANAFMLRGASIKFADSSPENPNIDPQHIRALITQKTKAIVVVHYAGVACAMDEIMKISGEYNLLLVEDAAHAIDSFYKDQPLGSIGHLGTFSFHETKNIIAGEGGMLVVNDASFNKRAEIIWEKGTNRVAFSRREVSKYNWMDIGSSFLPSELVSAFLFAQLENIDKIQSRRKALWQYYYDKLHLLEQQGKVSLPCLPSFATNNAHMFYFLCGSRDERDKLLHYLRVNNIGAVFHYLLLHESPYFQSRYKGKDLANARCYSDCIVRIPLYYELTKEQQDTVIEKIFEFYQYQKKLPVYL